ncbi:hypothetical protein C8C77_101132 [Halanaerobium saccharolyticum]|uniref:Uncharacterized protein n=1 Tax=Halanaerobium saccharolyticum TaxID=43595 RepID=A0A4R7Z954_9FIRM|nr:hypothetical protein [Halanaerobium saccharolyticum]RAK11819.1 hypothetical protein C7958_102132 [Halanaerobium saccharolyticum]TDW07660.1 hypothetical protein C8C77_101132 [Halanaerobium saccharolyticum]TDX64581.1 hypothetical protein C7956_101132 [Halanaerobium saccharolyticum]
MEYLFLGFLGLGSLYYIGKKVYGGIKGTDSPCAGCSDSGCPVSGGKEYDFDEIIKDD